MFNWSKSEPLKYLRKSETSETMKLLLSIFACSLHSEERGITESLSEYPACLL